MKWYVTRCLLALFVLTTSGMGQSFVLDTLQRYNFDFTGGGARAEGMGKAFIAVSDDITAGSWNPAGLYVQEKPILAFSYGSLAPRGATNSILNLRKSNFPHTGSIDNVTSLNFVAPIRIKGHHFVGSFNYTRNSDDFHGAALFLRDSLIINMPTRDDTVHYDVNTTTEFQGGLNSVNVGFGTRFYKKLSFGVSLNIYTGEAIGDTRQTTEYDRLPDPFYVGQYNKAIDNINVVDTNKFSGFNVTVGFKLSGEKLDLGLIVRTPFSLNVKTGRSIFFIREEGGIDAGRLLPTITDTTYFDDLLAKYDMPLMIGAGAAYRPSENLLLSMDAEYRNFSGGRVDLRDSLRIDPGGKNEEYFTVRDPKWNDVFTVRTGGEYLFQTGIGKIPVRLGLGYVPMPNPNIDVNGGTSTVVSYNFSAGSGLHWKQIHLDWAYTYSTATWKTADSLISVEQKSRNHHLNFTFTGYF